MINRKNAKKRPRKSGGYQIKEYELYHIFLCLVNPSLRLATLGVDTQKNDVPDRFTVWMKGGAATRTPLQSYPASVENRSPYFSVT